MDVHQIRQEKAVLGNIDTSMDKSELDSCKKYISEKTKIPRKEMNDWKSFKEVWDNLIRQGFFTNGEYGFIKEMFATLRMNIYRVTIEDFETQLELQKDVIDASETDKTTKDIDTRNKDFKYNVLISYVKSEASRYAQGLKRALRSECLSVFLDIDEQEANESKRDCLQRGFENSAAVVAIVTPRYGQTQWTHRQIIFAGMLHKTIIPVKFTETWPPRHLQAEFKDVKHIPWKEVGRKSVSDDKLSAWEKERWLQIGEMIKKRTIELNDALKSGLMRRATMRKQDTGKNFVAVIAHPKQKQLATQIKRWLENDTVWATCVDFEDEQDYLDLKGNRQTAHLKARLEKVSEMFGPRWGDEEGLRLLALQEKADKARVAIVIVSEDLLGSSSLFEQVVYCHDMEYVIPIRFDECFISRELHEMIKPFRMEDARGVTGCKDVIISRVKRMMAKK
ncbi:uncharacterized protein LOC135493901 [Lineus longissimus]|uniref:uncharacterized protein LOC135493901 n=1 Tax=Lineus longissimus TaxID=88925 RepID=UPI002B4E3D76